MGYLIQHDRIPYEPKKELKLPYWAITDAGRVVLITAINGRAARATVIQQKDSEDGYEVGDVMPQLALGAVMPLAEGESLIITNTWEIADG